ncbi:MAG: hypothetical protein ABI268_09890 [Rhodanobacter sp.]
MALNSTTPATIVAAPGASLQRAIRSLSIYNKDTATAIITISKRVSGTDYPLATIGLLPGQTLELTDDGWRIGDTGQAATVPVIPIAIQAAISDEVTAITTGTAKITFRAPYAFTLTGVRASLSTASSSGLPTFAIKMGGTSILSTNLSINATSKTSVGATTPAVISTSAITDDAEMTVDVTVAGTGAKGAKITLIGTKP